MEEAWRAHVGKLTLQQLKSPEACRAHLESFSNSVVSQGLVLTPVSSNHDVQDVITSFLRLEPECIIPPAESMAVLTNMEREFHIGVVLKEIGEIVKKAAREGRDRTGSIDPREHGLDHLNGALLKSRRSFTASPNWLAKIFSVLREQVYHIHEATDSNRRKTGVFTIQWDLIGWEPPSM
jgi:hypothetical protein